MSQLQSCRGEPVLRWPHRGVHPPTCLPTCRIWRHDGGLLPSKHVPCDTCSAVGHAPHNGCVYHFPYVISRSTTQSIEHTYRQLQARIIDAAYRHSSTWSGMWVWFVPRFRCKWPGRGKAAVASTCCLEGCCTMARMVQRLTVAWVDSRPCFLPCVRVVRRGPSIQK